MRKSLILRIMWYYLLKFVQVIIFSSQSLTLLFLNGNNGDHYFFKIYFSKENFALVF